MPDQRVAVPPGRVAVPLRTADPPKEVPEWVRYPETDGEPMPDGHHRRRTMNGILHALEAHFRGRDVYFAGDMFIYYREAPEYKTVAPDVFAVVGVPFSADRVYRPSKHGGRLPDFVLEVLSRSTREHDQTVKKDLYRELGVEEYFLFDSEAGSEDRALWAYRLDGGEYKPMLPAGMVSGEEEYASRVLRLGFRRDGGHVRVRDLDTGLDYFWPDEDREGHRRESRRRKRAEAGQARAEAERRAETERRERAEAKNTVLLERIAEFEAKLGAKPKP